VRYNTGETVELEHPCKHELIYEIEHFNRCISDGLLQSPVMDEAMTVSVVEIMENLKKSWG
jgi:hypothetical protein